MLLLVEDDDDISWFQAKLLVSFSVENDLLPILHSCHKQVYLEHVLSGRLVLTLRFHSPLSMWTSRIFFCRIILRPPQVLQRSFWLSLCPCPWQLWHTVDTCWTIPGSSWCMRTCIPVPWQDTHICRTPVRLPRPAGETNGFQQFCPDNSYSRKKEAASECCLINMHR